MKRYYLIDLENVGQNFTEGIDKLTLEDTLIVCHNKIIGDTMSKNIEAALTRTKAIVKRLTIDNYSKNAMDFCLCIQLGYLLAQNSTGAKYYIVSKDKGLDIAKDFVKSIDSRAVIRRIASIKEDFEEEQRTLEEKQITEELLSEFNKKEINIARRCLDSCETCFEYHNMLYKKLYPEVAKKIYDKTKHLYLTDK